ncbi:hypothetical protein [Lysinibacillus xylanilyticus]|uniref:hypothetical protein n=1 Tax=Lysinibacillus xylanilyticus TaxID=582475 RepID=UPI0038062017
MRESEAAAADVFCAKAKRQRQQQEVGHEGTITGRDGFSLRSSIVPFRIAFPDNNLQNF